MRLWGIKYMDLDERWWIDVVLEEEAPEVSSVVVGSRVFCDGFSRGRGATLVRRASVQPADLPDWPTDSAVLLRPSHVVR